jgi:hypothetical protein
VGDIDTVMVDSLKALDPERPIRQADISGSLSRRLLLTRCVRTARALTAVPGAKAKIKSSSKVLVAAVRCADPVSHGDSILWTAEALESVGYRLSGPVMRKTADVARRASNAGTRERAFDFLLRLRRLRIFGQRDKLKADRSKGA